MKKIPITSDAAPVALSPEEIRKAKRREACRKWREANHEKAREYARKCWRVNLSDESKQQPINNNNMNTIRIKLSPNDAVACELVIEGVVDYLNKNPEEGVSMKDFFHMGKLHGDFEFHEDAFTTPPDMPQYMYINTDYAEVLSIILNVGLKVNHDKDAEFNKWHETFCSIFAAHKMVEP